ncbi:hypothetical protein [Sphingomonas sp. PB4P5]|uniref:hypothetical protein n=1 Tax=Parasphingomonas puruogangriensis TaxID=3096155 RepID=UPI002FC632BD
MTHCTKAVLDGPLFSDERLRNALRRQIDRAINIDHDFTRQTLADDSGVNIHCIDAILSRDVAKKRRLAIEDAFSLAHTIGDRAVNALLAVMGYAGAHRTDEPDLPQPMQIVADGMKHFAIVAEAAADNRIDHTEADRTTAAADAIIATFLPLSSAGARS